MTSKITDLKEDNDRITFTISGIDICYINAIRRTIIADIPVVVFKTTPYEENKAKIVANTTRLNNEIIKHRLSCIPICWNYLGESPQIQNYLLELDVENKTDTAIIVTTKDFKIKDITTNTYLDEGIVRKIFPPFIPPNGNGEYFIDFVRLRPRLSDEIPGEKIKLTCEFSVATASQNSAFNVTGTCAYGRTPDLQKMEEQLQIQKQIWKDQGLSEEEIKFESANWKLSDGRRYVINNSFDFDMETIGIYDNQQILIESCKILINKMNDLKKVIEQDEIKIKPSNNTLPNSYDITLENEDYTVGNILNQEIYKIFYTDLKICDNVGFHKVHPHDDDSILRISLVSPEKGVSTIKTMLLGAIDESIKTFNGIKGCFDGTRNCAK